MARKRYGFDEAKIARFRKEGRGQGTGRNYKPWITVADVPSLGRVHRVYCPKTGREHHLMSDNEYYAFLLFWWDDTVIDVLEQFPLERATTLEIAAWCGVRHPVDPVSRALWVMTTDMVVIRQTQNGMATEAYAVKEKSALNNHRTCEKLEIERRYWELQGTPWSIRTNFNVKNTFTKNLSWILDGRIPGRQATWCARLHERTWPILSQAIAIGSSVPIRLVCSGIDDQMGYNRGDTLGVLRHFLAEKRVLVDLSRRNLQDLPTSAFSISG